MWNQLGKVSETTITPSVFDVPTSPVLSVTGRISPSDISKNILLVVPFFGSRYLHYYIVDYKDPLCLIV